MRKKDRQIVAIVPAGGSGRRMGDGKGKLFLSLGSDSVISATMKAINLPEIEAFFIPVSLAAKSVMKRILGRKNLLKKSVLCQGGPERQDSVFSGLLTARDWHGWSVPEEKRIVLIHDAARPLVKRELIYNCIEAAWESGAAGLGVPVKDTIKVVSAEGYIQTTPNRQNLWAIQTPQVFTWPVIWEAHCIAREDGYTGTDDASLVERIKKPVRMVKSSYDNIKITTPEDLEMAAFLHKRKNPCYLEDTVVRIGQGYDVHRLVKGRRLIIGGVEIPYELGLDGHSDADVAIHAIIDALLGAVGMADIGELFSDTDPQFKDIDSQILLNKVVNLLNLSGVTPINIDLTIIAQQPKLAPYRQKMKENIALLLNIPLDNISIKATTTEGLGFTGRGEGIAAQAVALVKKDHTSLDE